MVLYTDDHCLNQLFRLGLQNCYFLILSFMKNHRSPLLLHVAGQIFFLDSGRKLELCSLERVKQGFYWLGWYQLQSRVCMANRLKIVFEWMFACRMLRPSTLSQPLTPKYLETFFWEIWSSQEKTFKYTGIGVSQQQSQIILQCTSHLISPFMCSECPTECIFSLSLLNMSRKLKITFSLKKASKK